LRPVLMESVSVASADSSTSPTSNADLETGPQITFSISHNNQSHSITMSENETVNALRLKLHPLTGVPAGLQKLMYKGLMKDDNLTLAQAGVKNGVKIMLMGSTIDQVMAASTAPVSEEVKKAEETEKKSEPLSEQLPHKKQIEKGPPEGLEPGKIGKHDPLPDGSIQNLLNNIGQKVRLTFKVYTQELWIQSSTNTQKIPFSSIQNVTSEAIKGQEAYHIMALHLGGNSKYWLYWVPCQYIRVIKNTIMTDYGY